MIKYICDQCGQEVVEQEVIGPGVVQNYPDNPYMGKRYEYEDEDTGIKLVLSLNKEDHDHFCKACMWKIVERMLDQWGPQEVEPVVAPIVRDDLSHTEWTGAAVGPFTVKFEASGLPKPPFFVKVLPNEEADSSPATPDSELSELYFEGVLQESGPDEPADDPGTANPTIPNRDERPGWWYQRTGNPIF